MRMFGHIDPIGPDHLGPEARWAKQKRRSKARKERKKQAKKPEPVAPEVQ